MGSTNDLAGLITQTPPLGAHTQNFKEQKFNLKFQSEMSRREIELWLHDSHFIILTIAPSLT